MVQTAPTLQDVARVANVSTATVSRCLNTPALVGEETRRKVMAAVTDLGYSPNFRARALVSGRSHTIGAIIPTMENAIFARGIQAFQEELADHGFTLLIASSSYREDVEEGQIRHLVSRGAEALLLIGHHRDPVNYRFLERQGIPALVAWVYDPDQPQMSIGFDNQSAMTGLAREVIAMGHRRIAAISAPRAANDRARNRIVGICDAMEEAGLDPATLDIVEAPYGIETGAEAFATLMTREPRPTVVMCGNDVLAAGALRQATQMGLRVPGDISITGFDDLELATLVEPQLTTVHVPHREMGRRAARVLVAQLDGGAADASIELQTRLCLRGSLAPPPDGDGGALGG
ncbi:LacI family DNA-binding transcriptional regulator [Oceanibium sediminis]|uniref:LacI family DNA-binding transcriptional regulator n=1 Tax=Oceanibium sediminis TaxID=2026339 RepID=UPI000DD3D156|nr:LacI family DNA-binding transcriptional regulator [Oceanibium sediminis]